MKYSNLFFLSTGILGTVSSSVFPEEVKHNYNVLFIAVDDLRPELGCYGNTIAQSPYMDRLASEGVLFNRAYCQQAISMASRASIMTGYLPEKKQIYTNHPANKLCPAEEKIEDVFRKHNYSLKGYGKIYNYESDNQEQFIDYLSSDPNAKTRGRGYLDPANQALVTKDGWGGKAFENMDVPDEAYLDGFMAEEAVQALGEYAKTKETFYMAVGFKKPHLPFIAPKKYWDLYDREDIRIAENQSLPINYDPLEYYNFEELRNGYDGIPREKALIPIELQHTLKHGYYACVSYIDAQIGKLLNKLSETGLDENTIVVLWSDHGFKLGEHGMWCKHTNFEVDTRVPLIIKVPDGKTGVSNSFVELIDIYPTLMELCGFDKPSHLDGQSLVRELENPDKIFRHEAFSLYPRNKENTLMGYSVVNNRYRYTKWVNLLNGATMGESLYDHTIDPGENINISHNLENKNVIEEMNGCLTKKWIMNASILTPQNNAKVNK